eukprot:4619611-Pleurochrysis_carterae.AAC.1
MLRDDAAVISLVVVLVVASAAVSWCLCLRPSQRGSAGAPESSWCSWCTTRRWRVMTLGTQFVSGQQIGFVPHTFIAEATMLIQMIQAHLDKKR